jgi:hypothetical protein
MPSVSFKPTISAGERPQTYALDRAATGGTGGSSRYATLSVGQLLRHAISLHVPVPVVL